MKLAPRESEKLALHNAGYLAQKRLARGLKLNYTEAVALIASQILEFVRDGDKSVVDLANIGKLLLGRRQVLPSVVHLLDIVQVEGTFPDGTKLVTIYDPIACENGRLELALHGSFLPAPSVENFRGMDDDVKPGEIIRGDGPILINTGRKAVEISVVNKADRPVQVPVPPEVCRCCSSSSTLLRSSPAPLLLLLLSCCKYIAGGTISQWFVCLLSSRMILRGHTIHKVLIISIRCCCCWNFYSHGLAAAAAGISIHMDLLLEFSSLVQVMVD